MPGENMRRSNCRSSLHILLLLLLPCSNQAPYEYKNFFFDHGSTPVACWYGSSLNPRYCKTSPSIFLALGLMVVAARLQGGPVFQTTSKASSAKVGRGCGNIARRGGSRNADWRCASSRAICGAKPTMQKTFSSAPRPTPGRMGLKLRSPSRTAPPRNTNRWTWFGITTTDTW